GSCSPLPPGRSRRRRGHSRSCCRRPDWMGAPARIKRRGWGTLFYSHIRIASKSNACHSTLIVRASGWNPESTRRFVFLVETPLVLVVSSITVVQTDCEVCGIRSAPSAAPTASRTISKVPPSCLIGGSLQRGSRILDTYQDGSRRGLTEDLPSCHLARRDHPAG